MIFSNKQHETDLPLGTQGIQLENANIHRRAVADSWRYSFVVGFSQNEVFGLPCLNLTIKLLLILIEEF
ncbi:MAG: hypothetical protein LOD88_06290 [Novibacillus thermophilus]